MNIHLTDEQISKWIAGDSTPKEHRHGLECAQCAAKLTSLQNALSAFRSSATTWAEKQGAGNVPDTILVPGAQRARTRSLRRLAAAAAVVIVALIPAYKRVAEREREARAMRESQFDAQLLERINAHLSRTAPASLQPLMEMTSNSNDVRKEGDYR
jgi:hypothetical protein